MILRLIIYAAAMILLVAIVLTGVAVGRRLERRRGAYIDVNVYHRLGNLVRALNAPPADVNDIVILPDSLKQEAKELIEQIGAAPRFVRR